MSYIQKFVAYLLILILTSCSTSKKLENKKGLYKDKRELLKDYAFCQCMLYSFEADSIKLNDVSISVLYELSDYSISLLQRKKMDSIAQSFANTIEPLQPGDYGNKRAVILECLHFYKSRQLKKLINSINK